MRLVPLCLMALLPLCGLLRPTKVVPAPVVPAQGPIHGPAEAVEVGAVEVGAVTTWDGLVDRRAEAATWRRVRMRVTAYCPGACCCGDFADGVTASGLPVTIHGGRFVAADTDVLPIGSVLRVPGYHDARPVEVLDRGSAIVGRRLDVFFPDHATAKRWGVRDLDVLVREPR